MPRRARLALAAVDALRRDLRTIADSPAPLAEKRGRLAGWRREVDALATGTPSAALTLALMEPLRRLGLPRAEIEALVSGFEMTVSGVMVAPLACDLRLYCRRSGGAMAALGLASLGDRSDEAGRIALALGEAAQLTAILRDLPRAAGHGRLHLPRETLAEAGIVAGTPLEVLGDPALPDVCEAVAATARSRFQEGRDLLADLAPRAVVPTLLALDAWSRLLDRLATRGWHDLEARPRLGRLDVARLTLRHMAALA